MSLEGKILIPLVLVLAGWSLYSHSELNQKLRIVRMNTSTCRCPQSNAGQLCQAEVTRYGQAEVTSHSYFERMLEALIRHAGLDLEKARASLKKDFKGKLPLGWRWLKPWEGTTAPTPRVAPKRTAPPKRPRPTMGFRDL